MWGGHYEVFVSIAFFSVLLFSSFNYGIGKDEGVKLNEWEMPSTKGELTIEVFINVWKNSNVEFES